MKIFLSVSFSAHTDKAGVVDQAYRSDLETVIQKLEDAGHDVFCAPRLEGWKVTDHNPVHAFQGDLKQLNECDLYVGILGKDVSAGVQIETGYALALEKRMVLASHAGTKLGWTNNALTGFENVSSVNFSFYDELADQILELTTR
jgi:nucleoside 2-deoxyribosyltransferase